MQLKKREYNINYILGICMHCTGVGSVDCTVVSGMYVYTGNKFTDLALKLGDMSLGSVVCNFVTTVTAYKCLERKLYKLQNGKIHICKSFARILRYIFF